jgi:hypothetical protein
VDKIITTDMLSAVRYKEVQEVQEVQEVLKFALFGKSLYVYCDGSSSRCINGSVYKKHHE